MVAQVGFTGARLVGCGNPDECLDSLNLAFAREYESYDDKQLSRRGATKIDGAVAVVREPLVATEKPPQQTRPNPRSSCSRKRAHGGRTCNNGGEAGAELRSRAAGV